MYEEFFDYDENTMNITDCKVSALLPNPFVFDNGDTVKTKADWEKRRKEIYKSAVELQYGTMPPSPDVFAVEQIYRSEKSDCFRITAGTRRKQLSFYMKILKVAKDQAPMPVAISGDLCFNYAHDNEYVEAFFNNNVNLVLFDRTELAPDMPDIGRKGPLYDIYPRYTFGAIGAWAWGYSRCVDALEKIGGYDMDCIVFTGHSRGAKTALLAGILDERAAIVNPNESCQGGTGSYRIQISAITTDGHARVSETLASIWGNYPFWFGPKLGSYATGVRRLPFDAHSLKAMVAPRILLDGEAIDDIWANPVGSYYTTEAAAEVYKFLGVPENILWYFRRGHHAHTPADISMLMETIHHYKDGAPLSDRFFKKPFSIHPVTYDFKAPERMD